MKKQNNKYDLEERLLNYTVLILRIVEKLPKTRTGNHIAEKLIHSGTLPYPNYCEAQAAELKNDFILKMSICLKELIETKRWLKLIERARLLKNNDTDLKDGLIETEELIKIF
ncbi:MAG: four helix bundle protein [Bacteroidales bacterium]|nr:four helix bundle protein [Bacteroidales bacterium]